ncbi:unnamed protein product [Echinostoma caproni]|uniref:protein-histidine N-methyltransferase n=1 Tax=Echinostoma caproni TaxID=27848 RepID=A0A183AJW8_9TREM|nr:unnamed protein product [Echinostoma caproni]
MHLISEKALERYFREQVIPDGSSEAVIKSLRSGSDIVPGLVEGGFIMWDGSRQLVEYILTRGFVEKIHGKCVLELGCGAGLPGLVALKLGASLVMFQDYNVEVLTNWTIPNVKLNATGSELDRVQFVSGDWVQLATEWESNDQTNRFDVILTAETIYRPDLYGRLHRIFDACLASDGLVLLFCKVTYGPGGTLWDFLEFVNTQKCFKTTVNQVTQSGVLTFVVQLERIS